MNYLLPGPDARVDPDFDPGDGCENDDEREEFFGEPLGDSESLSLSLLLLLDEKRFMFTVVDGTNFSSRCSA